LICTYILACGANLWISGEGDGKNDVTDQIENEEQLLGLKGDDQEAASSHERKELKEDEVDTGKFHGLNKQVIMQLQK
jgi:hypothetical protein